MRVLLVCMLWCLGSASWAHEVRPAVGDLRTQGGVLYIDLRLNAEAILSGTSLAGIGNTDETGASDKIDSLRALEPSVMQRRVRSEAARVLAPILVRVDGARIALNLADVVVEDVGNTELPRETVLRLEGQLPSGTQALELIWPAQYGVLILRQQDVEDGYTGFLSGGSTGPIIVDGGR